MSRFPTMPYGYLVEQGFIGILPDGRKMLFPTQDEYIEYLSELNESAACRSRRYHENPNRRTPAEAPARGYSA